MGVMGVEELKRRSDLIKIGIIVYVIIFLILLSKPDEVYSLLYSIYPEISLVLFALFCIGSVSMIAYFSILVGSLSEIYDWYTSLASIFDESVVPRVIMYTVAVFKLGDNLYLIKDSSEKIYLVGMLHYKSVSKKFWFDIFGSSISGKGGKFPCKSIETNAFSKVRLKTTIVLELHVFYEPELGEWIIGSAEYLVIRQSFGPSEFVKEFLDVVIEVANNYLPLSRKVNLKLITKKQD